jgi:hypothetical protein
MFLRVSGDVVAFIDTDHDKIADKIADNIDNKMESMIIKSLVFFIFGIVFVPIIILSVSIVFYLPLLMFIFLCL